MEPFRISSPVAAGRKKRLTNLSLWVVTSPPAQQGHNLKFRNSATLSRVPAGRRMAVLSFTLTLPQVCRRIFAGLSAAVPQHAVLQTLVTRGKWDNNPRRCLLFWHCHALRKSALSSGILNTICPCWESIAKICWALWCMSLAKSKNAAWKMMNWTICLL